MAHCAARHLGACFPSLSKHNWSSRTAANAPRPIPQAARLTVGTLERNDSTYTSPLRTTSSARSWALLQLQQRVTTQTAGGGPTGNAGATTMANTCFSALFAFFTAVTASATTTDWYLDAGCFATLYGAVWWSVSCAKLWEPRPRTLVLASLLPVLHMLGAMGLYHWELGNLSWDVLVHLSNGFIGTLLLHSLLITTPGGASTFAVPGAKSQITGPASMLLGNTCTGGMVAPGDSRKWPGLPPVLLQLLAVAALLLLGTSLVEVVEWAGGVATQRAGEGMFFRGAGDFCTAAQPCAEDVDSAKDMVDNVAGMLLALVAIATGHTSAAPSSKPCAAAQQLRSR